MNAGGILLSVSMPVEVTVESCEIDFANQTKPNQPHPEMNLGLGFRVCLG
jgi:hypothetical protein